MTSVAPHYQFASDNTSGICPEAWAALAEANAGHHPSYGTDVWTQRACDLIRGLFEKPDAEIYFVFTGTAANSLALASLCQSYHSVICHESSHVETDECGAPEFFSNGTKLLLGGGEAGKLSPLEIERLILKRTDIHYPKPRVVSLTQSTELGTVYAPAELAAVSAVARKHGVVVHVDGARFANALATFPRLSPADLSWRTGVDVLCLGGAKNGMAGSEAVVFFNPALAREFDYRCKQAGHLGSKMRFLGSQWTGVLQSGAWLRHAAHANRMAQQLARAIADLPGLALLQPPEANAVFVSLPPPVARELRSRGWRFYDFIGGGSRFMCSWATQPSDVDALITDVREAVTETVAAVPVPAGS